MYNIWNKNVSDIPLGIREKGRELNQSYDKITFTNGIPPPRKSKVTTQKRQK